MKIGIDVDGVLTNVEQFCVDYVTKYCVENNVNYNINASEYDISKTFNIGDEQKNNFWKEYLAFYAVNEKARPFAAEVIKKLKEQGHEIYIITARLLTNRDDEIGDNMRKLVKEWLHDNNIVYDKLIFCKEKKERKIQEIRDTKVDIMIEDNPDNIMELSNIVPIFCYHATYNEKCFNENIIRCYSWYDIYNKINNFIKR